MRAPARARLVLAAAVASVAMLALPSTAPAHETGEHAPATAACPGGDELSNAICFALRGLEYSARHGGTSGAANELKTETEGNATTYQNTTVTNVGNFKTSFDVAVVNLDTGVSGGIVNALTKSDLYAAGLIEPLDEDGGSPPPCPISSVPTPVFPTTAGALKVLFCDQWAVVALLPNTNTAALVAHIQTLPQTLIEIEEPLATALTNFGQAVQTAASTLGNATTAATRTLGANQVLDSFYAAQCIRKADYGPFTRPTPCPPQ